jgi:hypothetical protein
MNLYKWLRIKEIKMMKNQRKRRKEKINSVMIKTKKNKKNKKSKYHQKQAQKDHLFFLKPHRSQFHQRSQPQIQVEK